MTGPRAEEKNPWERILRKEQQLVDLFLAVGPESIRRMSGSTVRMESHRNYTPLHQIIHATNQHILSIAHFIGVNVLKIPKNPKNPENPEKSRNHKNGKNPENREKNLGRGPVD